ncbi:YggT family protein [Mycetocola lacteus]|uniref:YggT family protein n=1 Tax=Mycetocola lacteus TaxID=76637 RepID=A0A3L7ATE1_9MICO|nr:MULTISPECIES: YggT family protein [Mycetocola]MCS4276956.1 YggT family protein [Mycetocola sp. BIGb0189]RLP82821.1 YggT family protein [Mycetocola lacteus]
MIGLLRFIIGNLLLLYFLILWARFALELFRSIRPGWRPGRALMVIAEIVFTVTDPPIRFFRRILPPVRIGGAMLDFGWSITMFCVLIAMTLVNNFLRI